MKHRLFVHRDQRSVLARVASVLSILFIATVLSPAAALASGPGDDPDPPQQNTGNSRGFAFGQPSGFALIKGGLYVPRGSSDIYSFNEELLTLDSSSYLSGLFGIDIGIAVGSHVDLVFGFEYSSTSPVSEFRDFVDEFDAPITQQTRLRQVPLTASVRFNLVERGQAVGSYAWIPAKAVPYLGGGAAIMWWRYEQYGDFVDFEDFTIFTDVFQTQGWTPSLHVFGGVDVSITPRFALNFEGRYGWAEDDLAPAFVGFEPIDLAGFRFTVGASIRF